MKLPLIEASLSAVIAAAWADDVSFDRIKDEMGLPENEVISIMRRNLKPKSFVLWRKRVSGRKSKHENRTKLLAKEIE
jgi:uncharacterized protein (TIGR03643 family)